MPARTKHDRNCFLERMALGALLLQDPRHFFVQSRRFVLHAVRASFSLFNRRRCSIRSVRLRLHQLNAVQILQVLERHNDRARRHNDLAEKFDYRAVFQQAA